MKRGIGLLALSILLGTASLTQAADSAASGRSPQASDSGFEIRLDGGLVSPVSGLLYENYQSAYSFGGAVGYHTGWFSILLDTQFNDMDPSPSSAATISFNSWEWALVEKARFGAITNIKPYVFLGEGIALSSLTGSSTSETDPLAEAGLGMDFMVNDKISLFLQGKAVVTLAKADSPIVPDKTSLYIPLQLGMDFVL